MRTPDNRIRPYQLLEETIPYEQRVGKAVISPGESPSIVNPQMRGYRDLFKHWFPDRPTPFPPRNGDSNEMGRDDMFGESGGFRSRPPLPRAKPKPPKARRKERLIKALFKASHGRDK